MSSYLIINSPNYLAIMIIAILGEKGGTGKTTFATNLAGLRAATGCDVLIIDADRQGSASYWFDKRDDTHPEVPTVHCVQKFGSGLVRTVRDMARRYDDIIIDAGAGDSREVESTLRVADRAIIPVQPAGLDVWTLGLIDDRVDEAKGVNDALAAWVVMNRASANPRDNDVNEAAKAIAACENLQLADIIICDRVAVKRATPVGLTVSEYKPFDPKAAHEMAQLYNLAFAESG
ncbi:MAG: AAA family ATPase [Candidatus Tectomicrobia bacterium]|nr:AAA family ATPase [Candidatus Tectomicrobia bacterium]